MIPVVSENLTRDTTTAKARQRNIPRVDNARQREHLSPKNFPHRFEIRGRVAKLPVHLDKLPNLFKDTNENKSARYCATQISINQTSLNNHRLTRKHNPQLHSHWKTQSGKSRGKNNPNRTGRARKPIRPICRR